MSPACSRRAFLLGAAAAVATPDMSWAAAALARARHWSLAVADVQEDVAPRALRLIHGRPPAGLTGALYRNGPARFRRPGGSAAHWFDGDGMIRRFRIADGQASLAARFADTPKRRREAALDAMVMPGFGTPADPRARMTGPDDANAANTSVLPVGDRLWALWEAGSPWVLDPETLASQGFHTLRPDLKSMPFSAHPRVEPGGRIWNIGMSGARAMIWRLSPAGGLEDAAVIDLPRASYVHDFTVTARHLVLVLQPWIRERPAFPLADAYAWKPEEGTQVLIVDKADLGRRRVAELPAFGFFHLGEGWEEPDGTIRFDVCAYRDMRFAGEGARALLEGRTAGTTPAELALAVLPPSDEGRLERAGAVAEFPRSLAARAGLPRRLTVHTAGEADGRPLATGLGVTDWESGRTRRFDFGPGHVVDELVPVAMPGARAEHEAWLIGPSINLRAGATELHVFDAAHVEDGPIASWRADVALPASFHGQWVAG
ncbi:MAG: carotenoid oxygenase family protein [Allosphingosinicella sp.]|uniref:carotenoid oxygenase family protein n=1 Tax=Allosphingosinicella sp. TaxID=2823234 RepID=UPI00395EF617